VLGPDTDTPVGEILDNMMQIVNTSGLLDPYMGAQFDHTTRAVWLYFSSNADRNDLEAMADAIRGSEDAASVEVYPGDEDGGTWVVAIGQAAPAGEPQVSGDLGSDVPLSGDVSTGAPKQSASVGET